MILREMTLKQAVRDDEASQNQIKRVVKQLSQGGNGGGQTLTNKRSFESQSLEPKQNDEGDILSSMSFLFSNESKLHSTINGALELSKIQKI